MEIWDAPISPISDIMARAMTLLQAARFGNYKVMGPLGIEGMGEVYRAHDTRLERDVAIKLISGPVLFVPERLARFKREAQIRAPIFSRRNPGLPGVMFTEVHL